MSLQVVVNFEVMAEAADWIVVCKPAPLIVHPANRKPEPTLLGGLENLLAYEIANGGKLGIITRLDRDTSGLVLVAKTTDAARRFGWIFERREAHKEYLAIVRGWPQADDWECREPIIRAGELAPSDIWVRQAVHPLGRASSTRFHLERRFARSEGKFSLVRCFPETGRMHQIRVHLAFSGFPILGDKIYSGDGSEYLEWMEHGWNNDLAERLVLPRHALHAAALALIWDGQSMRWESSPSSDLQAFLTGEPVSPHPDVVIWSRHD